MTAETSEPLPSMTDLVERLTAELIGRFKPGEPVDDGDLDVLVGHLRAFRDLAYCVESELTNWRAAHAEAEARAARLRASLHKQPEAMQ